MDTGSHKLRWLTGFVAPLGVVMVGVAAYVALTNQKPQPKDVAPEEVPLVETLEVLPHKAGLDLEVDGVVVPFRDIELSAEVPGRIQRKAESCRAGKFVTAGTTLYEIDAADYELDVQRLKDQLAQAAANIVETEVELKNTESLIELAREEHDLQRNELARVQRLAPRAMSESEVDKAKRGEWLSRNTLLTLHNQIQLTKSRQAGLSRAKELVATQLRKAELDIGRTKIVSPVSGVVVKDAVEQDSFVQKGTVLAVIEDTSKVEVKCSLRMDDLMWLWWQARPTELANTVNATRRTNADAVSEQVVSTTGSPESDALPDGVDKPQDANTSATSYELPRTPVTVAFQPHGSAVKFLWQGTLSRYDGHGLDERTRTIPCRVVVDNPRQVSVESSFGTAAPRALMRGMFVSILIHAAPQTSFVLIPEGAVQPGKKILRVREGKLEIVGPLSLAKLVETPTKQPGGAATKSWIVHTGNQELQAGDHVVSSPLSTAYHGMPVKERSSP